MKINPVYRQETKTSARSFRFPMVILLFNGVLAVVALLDMYSMITQVRRTAEIQYSSFLSLYIFVAVVEFVLLLFLVPALTAGSISGEKERQTLSLMLTTRMTAADIVFGKLFASLSTVLLLIVSSFPILSLVFIYGGVTVKDVFLLVLCYSVTALVVGCIGIFCSACFKKSTIATVASYCMTVFLVVGTVVLHSFASAFMEMTSAQARTGNGGFFYLLLFNPASTFRRALDSQIGNGREFADFFPWVTSSVENVITDHWLAVGIAAQILLSAVLLWLAVKKVEPYKVPRQRFSGHHSAGKENRGQKA